MARAFRIKQIYRRPRSERAPMRVGLVLSGAVALGSFEAGAVFELMRAMERGAPLTIDLIAGSSAGAIVGALTARSLVTGQSYERGLRQWTEITLDELTSAYDRATGPGKPRDKGLLSSLVVGQMLRRFLVDAQEPARFQPRFRPHRLALTITMTNLDGLAPVAGTDQEALFSEAVTFHFHEPAVDQPPLVPRGVWERIALACHASSAFPGMFDPQTVPWQDRAHIPGLVDEVWENSVRLDQVEQREPGVQARMRYADGGVLDNHPIARAVMALPALVGEAGEELGSLVYDPRRVFLFIEPNPPATEPDVLRAGTPQSWFDTFLRAARLWSLSAAPHTSERQMEQSNHRQRVLLHFLAELAQRMANSGRPLSAAAALAEFQLKGIPLPGAGTFPTGPLDPALFEAAVAQFYGWLADDQRFHQDMAWVEGLPPGPVRDSHLSMSEAALALRVAYLGLRDDLARSLRDIHALLGASLGLTYPWVSLHQITPEDPRLMLRGEELGHFGGFFAKEFLQHDFEVGRYYAYEWLKAAVPGYETDDEPTLPPPAPDGLNWRLLWRNRRPLVRIAGRLTGVLLEMIYPPLAPYGHWVIRVAGWLLVLSLLHGLMLLMTTWDGVSAAHQLGLWLLGATALLVAPLTCGLLWLMWRRK